jgi:DNA-binding MarR family transcriptional regulator
LLPRPYFTGVCARRAGLIGMLCGTGLGPTDVKKTDDTEVTPRQYRALADFRYQLRRFLRYSEEVTRRHGLTPLQYQLLLQIKGYPRGERATVGELAERLQAKHHGVVALAKRCEQLQLLEREPSDADRRVVYLRLSKKGEKALAVLAKLHRDELRSITRSKNGLKLFP